MCLLNTCSWWQQSQKRPIIVCHTANKFAGISLDVQTGLWFHIYSCSRIYGAPDVKGISL